MTNNKWKTERPLRFQIWHPYCSLYLRVSLKQNFAKEEIAMKRYIRSGLLALSLSTLPLGLSALAQTGGQGYQGYQDRTTTTTRTDGRSDWGWLGLLGLLGLAGLMRRREEPTRHRAGEYRGGEPIGSR
jgi:MYXO-CTERM domain-containing protein